jgi:hypothetical protein
MYQQPDPTNHRYVYGNAQNGSIVRLDAVTGDLLNIRPSAPHGEPEYRFDWTAPILVSQHDPRTVYLGGNRLFITHDRGDSWTRTKDLSKQVDRDTLTLMGVRGSAIALSRNDGTSSYGEIVTIAESPSDPNVLWVGTDDGNLQVTRDGGETWNEVSANVPGVPTSTYVSRVVASVVSPSNAYATFDAHRDGDFATYVASTSNFGQTWNRLATELPKAGSANVIREHPRNPDVLFLGTEHALFASTDRGVHWARFTTLPTTAYEDLIIHPRDDDLVVATHGRSLFILDDLAPLVQWNAQTAAAPAHLFPVKDATIIQYWKDTSYRGQGAYAGENPPDGVLLSYAANGSGIGRIDIADASGALVSTINVPSTTGAIGRVTWDLRHQMPRILATRNNEDADSAALARPIAARGPLVSPGRYTATLVLGETHSPQSFAVRADPEMPVADAQYREREVFLLAVMAGQVEVEELIQQSERLASAVVTRDSVSAIQARLRTLRRSLNGLAGEFNGSGARQGTLYPPTQTHRDRWRSLKQAIDEIGEAVADLGATSGRGRGRGRGR